MESIKGYDHWKTTPPEPEEEKTGILHMLWKTCIQW